MNFKNFAFHAYNAYINMHYDTERITLKETLCHRIFLRYENNFP